MSKVYVFLVLFSLINLFTACQKADNHIIEEEVFFLKYEQNNDFVRIDTIKFQTIFKRNDKFSIYEYKNEKGNSFFKIDFINKTGLHIKFNKDTTCLFCIEKLNIDINGKKNIVIYKFIEENPVVDGASCYYISRDLGILIEKSTTWPIYYELIYHSQDKKLIFRKLISVIYNDKSFYKNPNECIGPPVNEFDSN